MNKNILEVENLSLSFDNNKNYIFKDLSFSLKFGEILSVIGLNGSGKSSLLKIISGIYKKYNGKIIKNYKKMSYVPQKINIDKTFPIKVYEFIKIYNPGIKKNILKKYEEKFKTKNLIEKNIGDLSGGELQKVLIISAIISKPDLILLDEPTAGIDIVGEEIFYQIISELKKIFPKISIILVSHNINLVYKNCDKVICLNKKNLCCHGKPLKKDEFEFDFGKYVLPYKHNPHKKQEHKKFI